MKSKKFKIGYTSGVFDMFHVGHLNILRRAKEYCDFLVVGVTTDELCFQRKQKLPVIPELDRMEIVKAIKYVDCVIPQKDMDKVSVVKDLNAEVVFVGSDWKGTKSWERYEEEFNKIGCTVVYLAHTDGISSTILREKISQKGN